MVADQLSLIDEVKPAARPAGKPNPVVKAAVTKLDVTINQKRERCYIMRGGMESIRVETYETETINRLLVFVPNLSELPDKAEFKFDPIIDVDFKRHMGEDKFMHFEVLSMIQRPGAPKPVEPVKQEVKPVAEIPFLPDPDAVRHVTPDELSKELDEMVGPAVWTADKSKPGQSQEIAAWRHFEREVWNVSKSLTPPKEVKIALAPHDDIPASIEAIGWPATRAKLQARLDYLKAHTSTQVDTTKETTVTDNSGLASVVYTAKDWADFLKEKKVKSADMLSALGIKKLSEWHGTLEDAYTIYLTKTTPVIPPDEPEDIIEQMEAGYADEPADDEPPAALGSVETTPTMTVDAVATPKGELIVMPRDPNKAILHVKSTKALVDHMFNDKVLIAGVDYGTIAGGRQDAKPSLLKPGAEKLLDAFQFYPVFKPTANSKSDWAGNGFFNFEYECVICDRVTGRIEGSGIGSCNSKESKYRYRWLYDNEAKAQGFNLAEMITKTYPKKGGGTYTKYRVDNEDIFDIVNTLSKMAQKRALVAATLNATGASATFTQDMEDFADWGLVE